MEIKQNSFLSFKNHNGDGASVVVDNDSIVVVLHKGQPIPNTGSVIKFNFEKNICTRMILKLKAN